MRPTCLCFAFTLTVAACGASTGEGPKSQPAPTAQPDAAQVVTPEAGSDTGAVEPGADAPAPTPPGPPVPEHGVDELPELEGKSEDDLRARFGEPTRAHEFPMAECCTEFTVELLNVYPPKAGHDEVRIREWTWAYEGYALTVWLHEKDGGWQVLDTCRYSDDVEF